LLSGSGHSVYFFFQAENGIRDIHVTGVQTCALPISLGPPARADLLAVEEHGRVVLLALADHHATLEVDRAEERAHRVDRGAVGEIGSASSRARVYTSLVSSPYTTTNGVTVLYRIYTS